MKDCPVCHNTLKEVPKYGVLIDVCTNCRGVWLDRGELEKVVALARDFETGDRYEDDRHDTRQYEEHKTGHDDDHKHGHYGSKDYFHGKKKKKQGILSVFEDIFD
ncbi:MAG: zf-TFIIB domain-containing protein [Bacillota bacterium]